MIRLTHEPIDYAALTESVRRPGCGGIVLFLGTVRDLTGEQVTEALEYEAYPGMAERKLEEIEGEVRGRWPVGEMAVVHRLGRLGVGEVSVAVAVSCPHRAEAFEACRYAIDRLKQIVPIWKKENRPDGSSDWVHPDGANVAALERGARSAERPNDVAALERGARSAERPNDVAALERGARSAERLDEGGSA